MSSENTFYGLYRGIIADANDPLNLGRAKLYIPQVLGNAVTDWAWPVTGSINEIKHPYATFTTNSSQAITTTTSRVTGWEDQTLNKIVLDANRFYVEETGEYLINVSTTIKKNSLGQNDVSLILRKNGTAVPTSKVMTTALGLISGHTTTAYTHIAPSGGGPVSGTHTDMVINHSGTAPEQHMSLSYILELEAEEYVEIACSASSSGTTLSGTPSAIATINLVGKYKPKPDTPAWAMFEGGDPNFPLWVGVF